MAGGIDEYGGWLDDVWLLDLVRFHWTRVTTTPKIEDSLGYLFAYVALYQDTVPVQSEQQFISIMETCKKRGKKPFGC